MTNAAASTAPLEPVITLLGTGDQLLQPAARDAVGGTGVIEALALHESGVDDIAGEVDRVTPYAHVRHDSRQVSGIVCDYLVPGSPPMPSGPLTLARTSERGQSHCMLKSVAGLVQTVLD